MGAHVAQNILGLDVSVANSFSMNISNRSHELIRVQFDDKVWNLLLHFEVLFHHSVGCIWDVVHDDVQIDLIGVVTIGIKALSHLHTVRMVEHLEDS